MSFSAMIKTNAKRAMGPNWGVAIILQLINTGISFVFSMFLNQLYKYLGLWDYYYRMLEELSGVPLETYGIKINAPTQINYPLVIAAVSVFLLINFLLMVPFRQGVEYWYLEVAKGNTPNVRTAFRYFEAPKKYFKTLLLNFNVSVRAMLWSMLLYVLPVYALTFVIIFATEYSKQAGSEGSMVFALIGSLLLIVVVVLGLFFFAVITNKYFLVSCYYAENEEMPTNEIICKSIKSTKGYRFKLLWFQLSFLGWSLLTMIPLVSFFVMPYMNSSYAMYALYIAETRRRKEQANTDYIPLDEFKKQMSNTIPYPPQVDDEKSNDN